MSTNQSPKGYRYGMVADYTARARHNALLVGTTNCS
jgi:hypothetical protein